MFSLQPSSVITSSQHKETKVFNSEFKIQLDIHDTQLKSYVLVMKFIVVYIYINKPFKAGSIIFKMVVHTCLYNGYVCAAAYMVS